MRKRGYLENNVTAVKSLSLSSSALEKYDKDDYKDEGDRRQER